MRALGLDVGSKTIGVAVSDEVGIAAHGLETIQRAGQKADTATVIARVISLAAVAVVVGIPYELSGREGPRARRVRAFMDVLAPALAALPTPVPMHEVDERFTTAEANRVLLQANLSRSRRAELIDQQAAALILQAWLDARRPRG